MRQKEILCPHAQRLEPLLAQKAELLARGPDLTMSKYLHIMRNLGMEIWTVLKHLHPRNFVRTNMSVIMESAISKISQHHLLRTAYSHEPITVSQDSEDPRPHDDITKAIASGHGLMGDNAHQGMLPLLDHPDPQ